MTRWNHIDVVMEHERIGHTVHIEKTLAGALLDYATGAHAWSDELLAQQALWTFHGIEHTNP